MHISEVHFATNYTWGSGGSPTWQKIADFLEEDFEPGLEQIISTRMGEGGNEQDGVELAGVFLATGATLPAAGTRTWIRVTGEDNTGASVKRVCGGTNGCRISRGDSLFRPAGGGPNFARIEYTATGGAGGSTVEDDAT